MNIFKVYIILHSSIGLITFCFRSQFVMWSMFTIELSYILPGSFKSLHEKSTHKYSIEQLLGSYCNQGVFDQVLSVTSKSVNLKKCKHSMVKV